VILKKITITGTGMSGRLQDIPIPWSWHEILQISEKVRKATHALLPDDRADFKNIKERT
jgi:hypothetical protein